MFLVGSTAEEKMKSLVESIIACDEEEDDEELIHVLFTKEEFEEIKKIRELDDW